MNLSLMTFGLLACLMFNPIPNDKILTLYKFKAFTKDKINVTEKLKFDLGRVENIKETGESAGNRHFQFFP